MAEDFEGHNLFRGNMGILGTQEIVILVIMLAIMFGAKKIPELARNAGRAKGEFQRGLQEGMSIAGEDMDRGGMTKQHFDESE